MVREKEDNNTKRISFCIKHKSIADLIRLCKNATLHNKTKIYSYEDMITWRHRTHRHIDTYTTKSAVRGVCGAVCVVVGVGTLWIPSGSVLLIMFGAGLMGYDVKGLFSRVKYEINLLKMRGWNLWK